MTEKQSCPTCESVRDVELTEQEETVAIKGRDVRFKARMYRCTTCGEEFETPEQLDMNLEAAREVYARLFEAPSPEQLVALRARYNASQKAFGMILGFGELTVNGYEHGAEPDSTNRLLLKLAENPAIFKAMYDINSSRIGALQRQRIESSDAFRSSESWKGLEAIASALTQVQRAKIEECAECYSMTILETVREYVSAGSFEDYSSLVMHPTYSSGSVSILAPKAGQTLAMGIQAAS